ncbi:hypothetical protein M9H77_24454 [Catharanthus roseus]|uniref:Uncharacterized protein n=1 Tax=Catharanthus roseus TaxID=4058 RepID=A0ACC0B045_CATRO|nr:hypothetical protein M9H77_24454 [Catharanthus roseus]
MEFWAARVQSVKHLSAVQASRLGNSDSLLMDEGEDDVRAWFPCPFCYVEVEVPVLCSHLLEEHCFDLKNAVCPICAATLGKDPIGHFTMQHGHSVKRRRKSQKSGLWSNASAMMGKDFRDLTSFLGTNSLGARHSTQEPTPDPFLSPFLCTGHISERKDDKLDESSSTFPTTATESSNQSLKDPVQEKDYEERMQRAAFLQELVLSTVF